MVKHPLAWYNFFAMEMVYLTQEGLKKLEEEYRVLKEETKPAIATRIDEARQLGDLSENAEYHAAKEEMAWAQTRFQELDAILRNAAIIQENRRGGDTITVGSTFAVLWNGQEKTFTIVGPAEVSPKEGKISNESPLGRAFLGKRVGDTVDVAVPDGTRSYQIKQIL